MNNIQLIVGLGNPGEKYAATRHNLGFMVIDHIVVDQDLGEPQKTKNYQLWMWRPQAGPQIFLVKPLSFMNRSGEVVRELVRFFKIADEDICVIQDDLDLELGTMRLRVGGGSGGHNGIASVQDELGFDHFKRVKLGIGRPLDTVPADVYVLQPFPESEQPAVHRVVDQASEIVVLLGLHRKEFGEETIHIEA